MKKLLTILFAVALGLNLSAQTVSPTYDPDVDGDNNIGINDLLALLSLFAENDYDDDGIWDSQDDCVGVYDECGVCNGSGLPEGYESCEEYYGVCSGIESVSFNGHNYSVVPIGNHCWFSENLRTDSYVNGDDIAYHWDTDSWNEETDGRQSFYNADSVNLDFHGRLYNWYAVNDSRGLCPSGWHVSTDEDFIELEIELGMTEIQANLTGWRGTDEGLKLKSLEWWDGNNTSGFSALPSGFGMATGYDGLGVCGKFWTPVADTGGNSQMRRRLQGSFGGVSRQGASKQTRFSVRCVLN